MKNEVLSSPIRWAGSKKRILNEMLESFKKDKENYIEPFLGSGVVMINVLNNIDTLHYKNIYVNDINSNIIHFYKFLKTKPKVIVTTGTHTAVPMCYIAKLFGAKIIWIETFANRNTKTLAGRLVYPIATTFVVQWEEMKKLYPKAEYWGWIY